MTRVMLVLCPLDRATGGVGASNASLAVLMKVFLVEV